MRHLAISAFTFVALAAPAANACDHLQSLGQTCAACSAPASATSSTVYTQTVTQALAPVIRYEIRPVAADVVIPDPLPEVPGQPTPIQPLPAPSCNAGAASGLSYSHGYSTHSFASGFNGGNSAYGYSGQQNAARAFRQQAIRNRNQAIHATATIRANRAVQQYGYDAQAQQAIGGNGKVKALPRLRNAIGSLFGKP